MRIELISIGLQPISLTVMIRRVCFFHDLIFQNLDYYLVRERDRRMLMIILPLLDHGKNYSPSLSLEIIPIFILYYWKRTNASSRSCICAFSLEGKRATVTLQTHKYLPGLAPEPLSYKGSMLLLTPQIHEFFMGRIIFSGWNEPTSRKASWWLEDRELCFRIISAKIGKSI